MKLNDSRASSNWGRFIVIDREHGFAFNSCIIIRAYYTDLNRNDTFTIQVG